MNAKLAKIGRSRPSVGDQGALWLIRKVGSVQQFRRDATRNKHQHRLQPAIDGLIVVKPLTNRANGETGRHAEELGEQSVIL